MKALIRALLKRVPGLMALRALIDATVLAGINRRRRFTNAFLANYWKGEESRSGRGSGLAATAAIRIALPGLCEKYRIRSMVDVPCGDFHWMQYVDLPDVTYLGIDIVAPLIEGNTARHWGAGRQFKVMDVVGNVPPKADMIFCRDLLVHLPFADIRKVIANFKRSGAGWLLTTNFTERTSNVELVAMDWRPLNFEHPPFGFPRPVETIVELCVDEAGQYADKSLCLWRLSELP